MANPLFRAKDVIQIMNASNDIKDFPLGISGFQFSDLYQPRKLKELHEEFWKQADQLSPGLKGRFEAGAGTGKLTPPQESELLIEVARILGGFVAKLFNVSNHTTKYKTDTLRLHPVFRFKKDFLNTRVFKRLGEASIADADYKDLDLKVQKILLAWGPQTAQDEEEKLSEVVCYLLDLAAKLKKSNLDALESQKATSLCSVFRGESLPAKVDEALQLFEDWATQVWVSPTRRQRLANWISYVRAEKLDFEHLVHTSSPDSAFPEKLYGPEEDLRLRDGFKLTDPRMTQKQYLREVDYCIYCHQRQKDSCTKGFHEPTGGYKKNPLGIPLTGCPLDERISEMHLLRREGETIGSLAMIMLDNPMCPGTGHRICNDCMKGCIFQKQDPVNIPQTETGTLTDVLNLPYGFEIYSLLTRFNPLNKQRPYALPYNGKNILVVGLGPAGYTLSHYLANEGFGVVGIDGLKLEPVDSILTGKDRKFPKPVHAFSEIKEELDQRILMGFGGVSEYGITVRWDKNFLSIIYLSLLRRSNVKFYGGIRFGGTINLDDAWKLGFDHVALATGAGKPTIVPMKNNLSRGIRQASDFLMALQLTGAFKKNSMANLQVRLPAIVIGGGLTAIDTATELLAYYPIQVEKTLDRYESLCQEFGEEFVLQTCDAEEKEILTEFLAHGRAVREERRKAQAEKRSPNFIQLVREWGGVSLCYRKKMVDSPAYRLNHEEVEKALEEGIAFIENVSPVEAVRDSYGAVSALIFEKSDKSKATLSAKSVCVAAGTSPNTIYEREFPGTFALDEKKYFFKKFRIEKEDGHYICREAKAGEKGAFFLSYNKDGKFVSFYGDNHPDYAGNVVKAMASAKHGAPEISKLFSDDIRIAEKAPVESKKFEELTQFLDEALVPRVVEVKRLTSTIVEVIVKGKYVANRFEAGQFYRLQNYETDAHMAKNTKFVTEGLALTGAWVDKERDLLSMIVLEMGVSSRLCAILKPGDPVVVMGPTGTPSEIPENENVLLVGGGLGNAVLLSIAKACREKGSKVVYFAGYKKSSVLFKKKEIEENTDQVIWSVDPGNPPIPADRPQDLSFVGNIVQAIQAYGSGKLQAKPLVPLNQIDRMIVIGSDRMMAAVSQARHGVLKPLLKENHVAIGSINSPMQCMMKEVCAQCLQKHVDPKTGKEYFVFSCFNQDQEMDFVDWKNLNERLKGNSLQEKLSNKYLDLLFKESKIERV